jgi:uncharacterized membrane protein HdeD (DUF308 family)
VGQALVLSFGFLVMAFGVFFVWLAFRQPNRELHAWGLANGGFHITVGATVVVASLMPDATLYVAGGAVVFLLVKLAARRRLTASGG